MTTHNQELIELIASDDVPNSLQTIKDFLRWTFSNFNRSDIYYGHGQDNAWDESLHLVLTGLELPMDLPDNLFDTRLTLSEKQLLVGLVTERLAKRIPVAYLPLHVDTKEHFLLLE